MLLLGIHDFEAATQVFPLMLVMFHKPGCRGCAALEPEYVFASDVLYKYRIPLAKVGGWLVGRLVGWSFDWLVLRLVWLMVGLGWAGGWLVD